MRLRRSGPPWAGLLLWAVLLLASLIRTHAYLVLLPDSADIGTVVFNASVYKLGSERVYRINVHRTAGFVHHILRVDKNTGQITLKRKVNCNGVLYPNLFTFYVDSTSDRIRDIDYYSLPVRILITGPDCKKKTDEIFDIDFDRVYDLEDVAIETEEDEPYYRDKRDIYSENLHNLDWRLLEHNESVPSKYWIMNNVEDKWSDTRVKHLETIHKKRKKRSHESMSFDMSIDVKLSEARQWISETFASFAIPTADKWQGICLKSSQFVNSLSAFLPQSIRRHCKVQYLDVNDDRFVIENSQGDLVAARDVCVQEPLWKVTILFTFNCDHPNLVDSDHRLKLVYHHQEFNDTDIARRVRRELRNQSPYFEQALYIAAVAEEQPPGVIVTTVRARDPENSPVTYSMSSLLDSRSAGMFAVDEHSGVITTQQKLDRERLDVHYFRIVAQDDTFPPRTGTTTLQINVMDCNDHPPVFEMQQYETTVREGVSPGTTVITLRATDQDVLKNAEIDYSIESISYEKTCTPNAEGPNESSSEVLSQEESMDVFRIDAKSGVLLTRTLLDRELVSKYTIVVKATDQASPVSDRMSSSATVIVTVLDDNDNYPQFNEKTYTVTVDEDISVTDNPIIAHIRATDADTGPNAAIRYAIIGGNTQMQFSIDTMSGDVSLVKSLDYELVRSYRLVIRAQDGGSPSRSNTTQLLINVKDINDNAPRFYTSLFQESVSESVPIGYSIVRVQAYDADEGVNAEIKYSIKEGERGSQDLPLTIDPNSGWVYTTRQLDREQQSKFQLQVVASDGGSPQRSATASLVVTVSDVNDNDPMFMTSQYETALSEDEPPGTPVATVVATDPDEDTRLHYEISSGNTRGRFAITSQNGRGLITVAQPLDFKQEKRYVLTITATDSGGRYDTATVNINITDANNFAPVFENAPYTASVFEDAPIGTTVVVVSATDSDVGINAQITYSLTSEMATDGSDKEFVINPHTGAVVTNKLLDRETISGYLLTVTARDGGVPSLSDTTDVEISVVDVNDNAPVFKQPLYSATIPEDVLVGTSVATVGAWDADIGLNGRVYYAIAEDEGTFNIDPTSGVIRTNKALDRESTPAYDLRVLAIDTGTPALSSTVTVHVRIEDINDSPPVFESDRITFYVPENSPIGTTVGEIYAHDPDEGSNAQVHYSIKGGDDSSSFSLETRQGSEKAELVTMVDLDYETPRKRYELIIRAASPPLWSDVHIDILVTDVNDNAPMLKDFFVVFNNYKDCFPVGAFGKVPAFDADVTDKLMYRILSGNNAKLILLNETSGEMTLSPQLNTNVPKVANMEISVSDGVNEVKAMMEISVRLITEDMLFNSITVRLNEMTAEQFLSPLLGFFLDGLAAIIPSPKDNIYIFSIQEDTSVGAQILNVSVSVRKVDGSGFLSPAYLRERVYLHRAILARLATLQVLPFDDNICVHEPCLNFEECLTILKFGNASGFIGSDTVLFRPIYPVTTFACRCPKGFTGLHEHYMCDTEVDLCYSSPCQNNGTCLRRESGYTCVCPKRFTGTLCEKEKKTKANCMECDLCSGACCAGLESEFGDCELRARTFNRNSFLTLPSLKQRHRFNLKMRFATVNPNGLLLYNGRYNERHDFIALEIISSGAGPEFGPGIRFSFSLGASPVEVTVAGDVADGKWHTVEIDYVNRTATLSLDDCDRHAWSMPSCSNRTTKELPERCRLPIETCHRFLDLTGPLQIGGLPSIPSNFQVNTRDYVGCISDLYNDYKFIDLNRFVADNGTEAGCGQKRPHCASNPCRNGAECREVWDTYHCHCKEGYTGKDCSEATTAPWRFNGDGMLSFNPLLRPIQLPWLNSISVRTRQPDSFLMSITVGQNNSIVLSLKSGIVNYAYNGETLTLPTQNLADGDWHKIEVKWLGTDLSVNIDYSTKSTLIPMVANKIQGQYIGKILIGGPDTSFGFLASEYGYFEGCIQDVRVGNAQSQLNRPTVRENVKDGCQSRADCSLTVCPTHASCVELWDATDCVCDVGRSGPACLSACERSVCPPPSRCMEDAKFEHGYKCICPEGTHLTENGCEINRIEDCPPGWWGKGACGPCNCTLSNGYHPHCNRTTGQCYCKERHYEKNGICYPCGCNSEGSRNADCTANGACTCKPGVIGRACDSCPNVYAEITLDGCQVVYDGCPKSYNNGILWPRTAFGDTIVAECPLGSSGKASRQCDKSQVVPWQEPDLFNCTSESFYTLRKQLSDLETGHLQMNTFVGVRLAEEAARAVKSLLNLRGSDILIAHGILIELLDHEASQNGLNLTHSQDKDYVQNIIKVANAILDKRYVKEWRRIKQLTSRGADYLMEKFDKYIGVLARSQHDTYTNPFEIITERFVIGVDIVTAESIYGFEQSQGMKKHYQEIFTTEKVILPDTTSFIHPPLEGTNHYLKTKRRPGPTVSFPKYNNYIENKQKFDQFTRILVPIDLLGINSEDGGRAAVAYLQWSREHASVLMGTSSDETVTSQWGVNLTIATSPLQVAIYVPQHVLNHVHDDSVLLNYGTSYNNKGVKHPNDYFKPTNLQMHPLKSKKSNDNTPVIISPHNVNHTEQIPNMKPQTMALVSEEITVNKESFSYKSLSGIRLRTPVRIQMWLDMDPELFSGRANPQCVYWSTDDGRSSWSRLGCHTEIDYDWDPYSGDPLLINCTCYHLSTFAVLIDEIDIEMIPEASLLETVTSYSGFSVALSLLLITLLILSVVRGGAATVSNSIHKHLIFSCFMAEMFYLINMKARSTLVKNEFGCKLMSMALQYWWSCAQCWVACDAWQLRRLLRELRDVNHAPLAPHLLAAYATPAVVLALAAGTQHHRAAPYCWVSVHEWAVWWGVGPAAVTLCAAMICLFAAVHAAYTARDHIYNYGNLRGLLYTSIACAPLWWCAWALALWLASCSNVSTREPLTATLAGILVAHAVVATLGYTVLNRRVRENLTRTVLRCMGRKVPLVDSSVKSAPSTVNLSHANRSALVYHNSGDPSRTLRHIGISASSTTSRSTTKTSSSPYSRSDGQLRHTSTSTSNYNSNSDMPSYLRGFDSSLHGGKMQATLSRKQRRPEQLECAEGEEGGSDSDTSAPRSLDLASSHSSDDEDNGTIPQHIEAVNTGGVMINPDLTADAIKQTEALTRPSLLDNIHDAYVANVHTSHTLPLDNRYPGLDNDFRMGEQTFSNQYGGTAVTAYPPNYNTQIYSPRDYRSSPTEVRDNVYGSREFRDSVREKMYSPRDYRDSGIATMLKNDYQRKMDDQYQLPDYVERMSEGSDKHHPHDKYSFPYTAEEDHTSLRGMSHSPHVHYPEHFQRDVRHPPHLEAPLATMGETSEKSTTEDDAETRV